MFYESFKAQQGWASNFIKTHQKQAFLYNLACSITIDSYLRRFEWCIKLFAAEAVLFWFQEPLWKISMPTKLYFDSLHDIKSIFSLIESREKNKCLQLKRKQFDYSSIIVPVPYWNPSTVSQKFLYIILYRLNQPGVPSGFLLMTNMTHVKWLNWDRNRNMNRIRHIWSSSSTNKSKPPNHVFLH